MDNHKTKRTNRSKPRQKTHLYNSITDDVYMEVGTCVTRTHKAYGFQGMDRSNCESVIFWVPISQCAEVTNHGKQYVVIPKWVIDSRLEKGLVLIPFTL